MKYKKCLVYKWSVNGKIENMTKRDFSLPKTVY